MCGRETGLTWRERWGKRGGGGGTNLKDGYITDIENFIGMVIFLQL